MWVGLLPRDDLPLLRGEEEGNEWRDCVMGDRMTGRREGGYVQDIK